MQDKINKRLLIISLLVLGTLLYTVLQMNFLDSKLADNSVLSRNSVLERAPKVQLPVYNSDELIDLEEYTKKYNVVVHFFASWCLPCEKEFPMLLDLTTKLEEKENLKFLFVIVDDERPKINKFLDKHGPLSNNITLIWDDTKLHGEYFGTFKIPETFFFINKSSVVKRYTGEQKWDQPNYYDYLSIVTPDN